MPKNVLRPQRLENSPFKTGMLTVSPHKLNSVSYVSTGCYTHYQTFYPTPRQAYSPKINPPPVRTLAHEPGMAFVSKKELNSIMPVSTVLISLFDCRSPNVETVSSQASAWEKISNYGIGQSPHGFKYSLQVKSRFYILKCS